MAFRSLRCRFVSDKSEVDRLLYIRQSEVSASDDEGRTLSVVGIPAFLQDPEVVLEGLFAGCGSVERVVVHPSQRHLDARMLSAQLNKDMSYNCSFLRLTDPVGYEVPALNLLLLQIHGWVEKHKATFPGNETLRQKLDAWTEAYEEEEARRKEEEARAAADDGWTVVERRGGRKRTQGDGISVGAVAKEAAEARARKAAKKQQQDLDFYRFMRKEQHLKDLVQLKRKFQEDVARVKEMRQQRKFKPY